MQYLSSRLFFAVVIYVALMLTVFYKKPEPIFDSEGKMVPFGLRQNQTLFSFGVFTASIAIIIYLFFTFIDLFFLGKSN